MEIKKNSENPSSKIIMSLFASRNREGSGVAGLLIIIQTLTVMVQLRGETDTYLDISTLLISSSTVSLDSKIIIIRLGI